MGGEVVVKLEYGTIDSHGNEETIDDQLRLSIQKLETISAQKAQTYTQSSESEEDDDQILRSMETIFSRRSLLNTFPSQCALHSRALKNVLNVEKEAYRSDDDCSSSRPLLPCMDADVMPADSYSSIAAAKHESNVPSINRLGHESNCQEDGKAIISGLPRPASPFIIGEHTGSMESGGFPVPQAKDISRKDAKKVSSGLNEIAGAIEVAGVPLNASPGLIGLHGTFEKDFNDTYGVESKYIPYPLNFSDNKFKVKVALVKNRQCQSILQKLLLQVEHKQKDNKELQRRMRTLVDFDKCCKRRFAGLFGSHTNLSIKLIKNPKLGRYGVAQPSESKSLGPPNNEDVEAFQKLQREFPSTFDMGKWSKQESEELRKGVTQQLQENLAHKMMEALVTNRNPDDEAMNLDDLLQQVARRTFTAEEIRKHLPSINWDQLARRYFLGRSGAECKIRWLNHEDRLVNSSPWTKVEDKRLLHISQQHGLCDWETIACQLNTNRTPAQCLVRYQRSLNATIMRTTWTPEEDDQLRMAVQIHGEKNWQAVAANIEGRTGSQCSNRWHKVVLPGRRCGRWSVEEDKRLIYAVSLYDSKQWNKIASHVPGRTDVQCRERWCNVLDPSLKREEWSQEEDKHLEEAVAKYGSHHWAAVANELKPRTDNQCWRRWRLLKPEHQAAFQKDLRIRRVALVPNFVGRKKERPSLGICDFTSEAYPDEADCRPQSKPKKERKQKLKDLDLEETSNLLEAPMLPGHYEYNGVFAKVCRQARMEKMRLSRAEGRLKIFSRKDGVDEGALNRLTSSRVADPSQAVLNAIKTCHETYHITQGALPFVSFVHPLASWCQPEAGPGITCENEAGKSGAIVARDKAMSLKNMSVQVVVKSEGWQEDGCEGKIMPLSEQSKDEEVAATTQSGLLGPFSYGPQRFWTPGWDNAFHQGIDHQKTGTHQEVHSSSSFTQVRNKRKRATSDDNSRPEEVMGEEKSAREGEIPV